MTPKKERFVWETAPGVKGTAG